MDGEGYIRLYWKTMRSLVGTNYIALGFWVDILASTAVRQKMLRNGTILEPGHCVISLTDCAKRAGVAKKTIKNYLNTFVSEGMVEVIKSNRNGTTLSVCNFSTYQPQFFDGGPKRNSKETSTKLEGNLNSSQTESPKSPKSLREGAKPKFTPPSIEQVAAYCKERNNTIQAERFVSHYQSQGWKKSNGQPVKDWKACVRTWEGNSFDQQPTSARPPERDLTIPR